MESRLGDIWTPSDVPVQIGVEASGVTVQGLSNAMDWAFGLETPELRLYTTGLKQRLEQGTAETLAERVRDFFAQLPTDNTEQPSPRILVGAIPFGRQAKDCLFLPNHAANSLWPTGHGGAQPAIRTITPEPSREAYQQAVARALDAIAASNDLKKVVLSRSVRVKGEQAFDPFTLWRALKADHSAVRFLTPLGHSASGDMRRLVGATPELLVSKRGGAILSNPLAGSARRSVDLVEDENAALGLKKSEKDLREHGLVVEAILDLLAPYCRELRAPPSPALVSTQTMWHLGTRIEGMLKNPDEVSAAELAAVLHPTPAVCGTPRDKAAELIGQLEGYDRGFYAGAVGWTNASGDGAWYVSLRCAETCGDEARLYAGAGIVAGSDPSAEADETSGKLQAVLRALGVSEVGL